MYIDENKKHWEALLSGLFKFSKKTQIWYDFQQVPTGNSQQIKLFWCEVQFFIPHQMMVE